MPAPLDPGKVHRCGVESGIHYKPNHLLTKYGARKLSLPKSEQLYSELITLPLHPAIEESQVAEIVTAVHHALSY